jgi:hypothetical protein
MSDERSWAADTVALGRKAGSEDAPPEPRRRRVSRPKPATPGRRRAQALGALALTVVVTLLGTWGGGSDSHPVPIRRVADPTPAIVAKPPTRMRRREPRSASGQGVQREGAGLLEDERKLKASARAHEPDAPEPAPEMAAEPVIEAEPETAPAAPTPTPPTSATAEFGL